MQAVRFVAVGELLVDVVADGSGHDAHIRLSPAGSAFNAAAAAVAAGAEATVIGTVGDDPGGRMILAELAAQGVHAEVTIPPGPTMVRKRRRTSCVVSAAIISSRPTMRVSGAGKLPVSAIPSGAAVGEAAFSRVTGAMKVYPRPGLFAM